MSSSRSRAAATFPNLYRLSARLFAKVRVSGWSSPSTRRRHPNVSWFSLLGKVRRAGGSCLLQEDESVMICEILVILEVQRD